MDKTPSESAEQIALVKRCRSENIFVFSIPNGANLGSNRSKFSEIEKLKKEGLVSGIPDLFIPAYKLFIEMKRQKGGVTSVNQHKSA